jgi:hypothetical protein
MEVANGARVVTNALVWVMVQVQDTTRIIAATVINGRPSFQLLLGRHWMASVDLVGHYKDGVYTIVNDKGYRTQIERTTPASPEEADNWGKSIKARPFRQTEITDGEHEDEINKHVSNAIDEAIDIDDSSTSVYDEDDETGGNLAGSEMLIQ